MKIDINNYLTNSARRIQRFAGQATEALHKNLPENIKNFVDQSYYKTVLLKDVVGSAAERTEGPAGKALEFLSKTAPFITGEVQSKAFQLQNPYLLAKRTGEKIGAQLGVAPEYQLLGGAAVGAGLLGMSGVFGNPLGGLRPAGQQAVYQVPKEEDPTGRTTKNPLIEAGARYFGGQRGQPLSYEGMKEDRPDVMPSTYRDYMRYQYSKPERGDLIKVDPERGTFTTLGGTIRGSAKGLNDPEIRVRGVPITASAVLGTAAGAATTRALSEALKNPTITSKEQLYSPGKVTQINKALGDLKDPALLAAGTIAALGTAAVTKKLFAKAQEERVKKEDPVEYLQYKHGNFSSAAQALGQPEARSWQELAQYVK